MGPPRCKNRFRGVIAASALILLAAGSAYTVAGLSSPPTFASGNSSATGSWTDNAVESAEDLVTNGQSDSPIVPVPAAADLTETACLAILAEGADADSSWSRRACVTTPWSETDARNDLLRKLAATPLVVRNSLHDSAGNTMDTAKVIQIHPGTYLAVYATGDAIKLARSTDLVKWLYVTDLDTSATQPYIAQGPNGSYILADEKYDVNGTATGSSHLYFIHYSNLAGLLAGKSDWFAIPPSNHSLLGDRFYSLCNEGTPDIHGISPVGQRGFVVVNFGFHYNSHCGAAGPDRGAYGRFQVTSLSPATGQATANWSATRDTPRNNAVANIGYTGSRGGRDDIIWHNWRFSIQEAQCGSQLIADCRGGNTAYDYTSWRYVLYDYSNQHAYPVALPASVETANGTAAMCHGNPKTAAMNNPAGRPVLVVTGFIFGPPGGCVPAGTIAGEFLYVVLANQAGLEARS